MLNQGTCEPAPTITIDCEFQSNGLIPNFLIKPRTALTQIPVNY
ncbi:hypothetical protein B6N60_02780 [Richelia sinica FACHB-800]|uniref:Uncharacterized protein n=1 Tax=Richelia sinica FACHB-800 TaxID=1357546 RepID=A0A975T9R6_9NOST|nr:hypothetical protein B6N60_02780 [Richelia sinica FACHB-800]